MFGPFKASQTALGGLLWKSPWRMSAPRKQRQRHRLKAVDNVIAQLNLGLHVKSMLKKFQSLTFEEASQSTGVQSSQVKQLRKLNDSSFFPSEKEMSARDKYTIFSRYSREYRKSLHKVPKWTKLSNRTNPENV